MSKEKSMEAPTILKLRATAMMELILLPAKRLVLWQLQLQHHFVHRISEQMHAPIVWQIVCFKNNEVMAFA